MFYSEAGQFDAIYRANLADGSDPVVLVNSSIDVVGETVCFACTL